MIIKKCHIDNFGKMSDFDFDFHEGLNTILEENSWGKTTFSVFIKSMFYGLEYNTKKVNERKMYEPWQGGVYGGSVVIDINGKEYKIERTFGKKDKDDTFSLYDVMTGKISEDYSENIGEELFQIDREAFVKSIYIPQSQTDTGMTDGLNAKIGNLSQAKDDISNYEKVKKILEEKKKEYGTRGKKSAAARINEEIALLKDKAEKRQETLRVVKELEEHIKEKKKEYQKTMDEKSKYNQMLVKQSKKTEDITLYNNALENLKKSEDEIALISSRYNGKEIEQEDVDTLKNESEAIKNLRGQLDFLEVNEKVIEEYHSYGKMFESGIPEEEYFSNVKNGIDRLKVLNNLISNDETATQDAKRFEELKEFFSEKYPTADEISAQIDNFYKAESLKNEVFEGKVELKAAPDKAVKKNDKLFVYAITGIIAIVIGVIILAGLKNLLGGVFVGAGVGILMYGIAKTRTSANQSEDEAKYEKLMAEIAVKEKQKEELEASYKSFVQSFRVRYSESVLNVLMEIKEKHTEYENMKKSFAGRSENLEKNKTEVAECAKTISELLSKYLKKEFAQQNMSDSVFEYEQAYEGLKNSMNTYLNLKDKTERYYAIAGRLEEHIKIFNETKSAYTNADTFDISEFEEDYKEYNRQMKLSEELKQTVEKLKPAVSSDDESEVLSVIDLRNKIEECDRTINIVAEDINRHERDVEFKYIYLEETDDIEDELAEKKNELDECKLKYDIIDKTLSYLQVAKDNFSARYLGPMRESFAHYLKMINGVENANIKAEDLDIDIDLNAMINYGSVARAKDSLSKGYQDLVDLCIRFALLDVMYESESPIIILDDPFVNLDKNKIENALDMVNKMSKQYQIIYFTCHSSRI